VEELETEDSGRGYFWYWITCEILCRYNHYKARALGLERTTVAWGFPLGDIERAREHELGTNINLQ
jgi:hypothetical protein